MDEDFNAWAKDVQDDLVPKLEQSGVVLQLVPTGPTDIKFAVELGLSIMMDKPIIALVHEGTVVPAKLLAVADKVITYTELSTIQHQLAEAIREMSP